MAARYQLYMENKDLYEMIATLYAQAGDVNMAQFYYNVAYGYKLKADKLTLREAAGA